MRKFILLAIWATTIQNGYAQKQGKEQIEKLCGCYEVKFTYAETFASDTNYQFHSRETSHALELITPIENSDNKIVLQHMLLVGGGHVIKHWREDWTYENKTFLNYKGNNTWMKEQADAAAVQGTWTQTVWQVDDMPRYQGYSAWITNNGKTYWENTAFAPLPRREYTTRSDYNLLKRTNRIYFDTHGWIHEQDNDKIIRSAKGDSLLAQEKGWNVYTKVDDSRCSAGLKAWKESEAFWKLVRAEWNKTIEGQALLYVKDKVDDDMMFEHLYATEAEWKDKKLSDKELAKKVKEVFARFVFSEVAAN